MSSKSATVEPIALSIEDTAEALSLGRDAVLALLRRESHPIPSFRYGARVLIPRRELVEWVADEATRNR